MMHYVAPAKYSAFSGATSGLQLPGTSFLQQLGLTLFR